MNEDPIRSRYLGAWLDNSQTRLSTISLWPNLLARTVTGKNSRTHRLTHTQQGQDYLSLTLCLENRKIALVELGRGADSSVHQLPLALEHEDNKESPDRDRMGQQAKPIMEWG